MRTVRTGSRLLESVGQDAKYAVRTLGRQPLHTLTALSVLVLAISMIASLFTAFKATSLDQRREYDRRLLAELEQAGGDPIAIGSPAPVVKTGFYTMNVVLPRENATDCRSVERRSVSRDYFGLLGIPLVQGRMFASDAIGEVIVNETFARVYWRGADALGQTIREVDRRGAIVRAHTIVGVARDAYLTGLERIAPVVFRPTTSGTFVTRGGPAIIEKIRATAAGLNAAATVRSWPTWKSTWRRGAQGWRWRGESDCSGFCSRRSACWGSSHTRSKSAGGRSASASHLAPPAGRSSRC